MIEFRDKRTFTIIIKIAAKNDLKLIVHHIWNPTVKCKRDVEIPLV